MMSTVLTRFLIASHNPKVDSILYLVSSLVNTLQDDNGYKVYWENAVQVRMIYS